MADYANVMVRFNMETEEKELYEMLSGKKATSIKNILKKHFLENDLYLIQRSQVKSIIREIVNNSDFKVDTEVENKIISLNDKEEIKINIGGKEVIYGN